MASWIPFIAEVGRRTAVPATQFIAAVMHMVAILISILFMIVSTNYYFLEGVEQLRARTKKQLIIEGFCTLLMLAMVIIAFFMLPIGDPPGRKDRVMIGSKLGMGFSGGILLQVGYC